MYQEAPETRPMHRSSKISDATTAVYQILQVSIVKGWPEGESCHNLCILQTTFASSPGVSPPASPGQTTAVEVVHACHKTVECAASNLYVVFPERPVATSLLSQFRRDTPRTSPATYPMPRLFHMSTFATPPASYKVGGPSALHKGSNGGESPKIAVEFLDRIFVEA